MSVVWIGSRKVPAMMRTRARPAIAAPTKSCACCSPFDSTSTSFWQMPDMRPLSSQSTMRYTHVPVSGTVSSRKLYEPPCGPFVRSEAGKALIASGKVQQVGHGTGGQVQGSVAAVAELRLGGTVFPGVEAALSSGVKAFEIGLFDGSLGVPFWKAGTITFDYPAKTLCIER